MPTVIGNTIMIKKLDKKNYNLLVKHNNLIQCKYSLDPIEQKLLYKIFEDIQNNNYQSQEIVLKFKDFYRDFKGVLKSNISKKEFINLIKSTQKKMPYILKSDGTYIETQWYKIKGKLDLETLDLILDEVKLILDDDIFEYVQSLDRNFTGLKLESLYSFKSFYAMRIYELIKQWSNTKKEIIFEPVTLKELLGVDKIPSYKNYTNFRKKVIEKAIDEINEKSELDIEVIHDKKGGKSVKEIKFIIKSDKEKINIDEDKEKVVAFTEEIKQFNMPEINFDVGFDGLFSRQFKDYDFENPDYHLLLLESKDITLSKDGLPKDSPIGRTNYRLFAQTLINKIETYKAKKEKEDQEKKNNELMEQLTEEQVEEMFLLGFEDVQEYLELISIG
ncbi:replication initiation protein [Paraclostridium bifermentans]|uniref:replication initiation protein n=1 Tax=Paraclostridium bifermentans TaxID=1490 RepID=UPI0022E476F0|nr:replication initiation protein [Paraclostridium bifermentans]